MFKKTISIFIAFIIMFSFTSAMFANAATPQYAITDTTVMINYVTYEINEGTILYNGKQCYVHTDYISYIDTDGYETIIPLPTAANKISNPISDRRDLLDNVIDLPYSAYVAEGDYTVITPTFNIINGTYYYYTKLSLSNFYGSSYDRTFSVIFCYQLAASSEWHTLSKTFDASSMPMRIQNNTAIRYGLFSITNLYGFPSPGYKYTVTLTNSL